jgi:hypothetical protein
MMLSCWWGCVGNFNGLLLLSSGIAAVMQARLWHAHV